MAQAIENNLRDSPLPLRALARGFIINRLREAFDRASAIVAVNLEDELPRRIVSPLGKRNPGIGLDGLLDRQRSERIGLGKRFGKRSTHRSRCRRLIGKGAMELRADQS